MRREKKEGCSSSDREKEREKAFFFFRNSTETFYMTIFLMFHVYYLKTLIMLDLMLCLLSFSQNRFAFLILLKMLEKDVPRQVFSANILHI